MGLLNSYICPTCILFYYYFGFQVIVRLLISVYKTVFYCIWIWWQQHAVLCVILLTKHSFSPGIDRQILRRTASLAASYSWGGAVWLRVKNKRTPTTRRTPPGPARLPSTATLSTSLSLSHPHLDKPPSYLVSAELVLNFTHTHSIFYNFFFFNLSDFDLIIIKLPKYCSLIAVILCSISTLVFFTSCIHICTYTSG